MGKKKYEVTYEIPTWVTYIVEAECEETARDAGEDALWNNPLDRTITLCPFMLHKDYVKLAELSEVLLVEEGGEEVVDG